MHITEEQLEQLRSVLVNGYDAVSFFPADSTSEKGYWYVTSTRGVGQWGTVTEKGVYPDLGHKSDQTFLKFATENDLKAEIAVYEADGRYYGVDKTFSEWQHLANYLGISNLVAVSTKIPKTVADKFRYHATRGSATVSETLRQLIYDYVVESIKDNAQRDMFRD